MEDVVDLHARRGLLLGEHGDSEFAAYSSAAIGGKNLLQIAKEEGVSEERLKQIEDETSLLNTVKMILDLRHKYEDLQADGSFEVVCSKKD